MDVLSVAASIAGLLTASGKVLSLLASIKDAPSLVHNTATEVTEFRAILGQLESFLVGSVSVSRPRASMMLVEQVLVTLIGCVKTMSELEEVVKAEKEKVGVVGRLVWGFKGKDIVETTRRLQAYKSSLILMLMIFECKSTEEAGRSANELRGLVEQMLERDEDIARRLENIEASVGSRGTSLCSHTIRLDDDSLRPTALLPVTNEASRSSFVQRYRSSLQFEEVLRGTRVYRRSGLWSGFTLSVASSVAHTASWSVFSGLSLTDISNISILSLPIYVDEILNAQWYTFGRESESELAIFYERIGRADICLTKPSRLVFWKQTGELKGLRVVLEWKQPVINLSASEIDISNLRVGEIASEPNATAGLVYEIPGTAAGLVLLYHMSFVKGERTEEFSIAEKSKLAYVVVQAVRELHLLGWLHRALGSQNILFHESGSLDEPHLVGFQHACRVDSAQAEDMEDKSGPRFDLYRHPDRAELVGKKFEKKDDIYALGLLLIEIGYSSRLEDLQKPYFISGTSLNRQISYDKGPLKNLAKRTSDAYYKAVLWCLNYQSTDDTEGIFSEILWNLNRCIFDGGDKGGWLFPRRVPPMPSPGFGLEFIRPLNLPRSISD